MVDTAIAARPHGIEHEFERQVLIRLRVPGDLLRTSEERCERRITGAIDAKRDRVRETANHLLEVDTVAIRDRHADDELVLA